MVIECPGCKARYRIDDSKIPSRGINIPCKKCKTKLIVRKDIKTSVHLEQKYEERTSGTHAEVKAESFKFPTDSKDKLPIEVFVRTAIENLREPPVKGIRMVHSGFADAFREYYSLDPAEELAMLVKEGKFATKLEEDDTVIYLPADAPISGTLRRILDPAKLPDPKALETKTPSEVLDEPLTQITGQQPAVDNLDVTTFRCTRCGATLKQLPNEVGECWCCGAKVGQNGPTQKERIQVMNDRQSPNWIEKAWFKKGTISFLIAMAICFMNDNFKFMPFHYIYTYIIASIFQWLAISELHRPRYKKVFVHNLWLTAILVGLFSAYLAANPQFAIEKYDLDVSHGLILLLISVWGYAVGYVANLIAGLLTVFWVTRTRSAAE